MFSGFGGGAVAGQEQTETATKIVLLATHFVVFFAVVPTLRQRMT
jgi:hypothetical protein